ncbi:hypothetical protein CSB37_00615 [bacterium DOLZORAL124_38_8]|nr:MAG: hypothetical protein CSB37_00615 [bacterium DOLZORAL124_38_8]
MGCGQDTEDNQSNTLPTKSKTVANKYAVVTVPEDWVVLKTPSSTPQLILMEKFPMTANLIDGEHFDEHTTHKIFEMTKNEFPNIELLEEISEKSLIFSVQRTPQGNRYKFEQHILELPKEKYLLASCSYPLDFPENKCDEFFDAIELR